MIETIAAIVSVVALAGWFLYSIHICDKLDGCEKEVKRLQKMIEEISE